MLINPGPVCHELEAWRGKSDLTKYSHWTQVNIHTRDDPRVELFAFEQESDEMENVCYFVWCNM